MRVTLDSSRVKYIQKHLQQSFILIRHIYEAITDFQTEVMLIFILSLVSRVRNPALYNC